MPAKLENFDFLATFIKGTEDVLRNSDSYANLLADELKSIVIQRIDSGEYLGGKWSEKPYSDSPIKAYKLGFAVVSGEPGNKQLSIRGERGNIQIRDEDWYWGDWDRKKKGIPKPSLSNSGEVFGDQTRGVVPIFVPGYIGWRTEYNGLGNTVDLQFTGNMIDNFNLEIERTRGSNQYGGKYTFSFEEHNIGDITDHYRNWKGITQGELDEAVSAISENMIRVIFEGQKVASRKRV